MLARLQQYITLSLLGLAAVWAAWFVHAGRPFWALLGVGLVVFGYALFLALEFVLVSWVHGSDPAPRPKAGELFRAWCGEVRTAPRVFCWQQPFRFLREPDFLPPGERRGVVLVHGFVCNRGLWNRWMTRLRAQGIPFVAVSMEPVFGSISEYAPFIEHAVQRLEGATGQAPVLVGHSMGGLAIRHWMATAHNARRVHRAITIASPHRGTWLGRFGMSQNTSEMAMGSLWQCALEARESARGFAQFTCFYSHCDNIVFPASTATLPGADNRHLSATAHVQLIDHPAVFDAVLAALAEVPGAATALASVSTPRRS